MARLNPRAVGIRPAAEQLLDEKEMEEEEEGVRGEVERTAAAGEAKVVARGRCSAERTGKGGK